MMIQKFQIKHVDQLDTLDDTCEERPRSLLEIMSDEVVDQQQDFEPNCIFDPIYQPEAN